MSSFSCPFLAPFFFTGSPKRSFFINAAYTRTQNTSIPRLILIIVFSLLLFALSDFFSDKTAACLALLSWLPCPYANKGPEKNALTSVMHPLQMTCQLFVATNPFIPPPFSQRMKKKKNESFVHTSLQFLSPKVRTLQTKPGLLGPCAHANEQNTSLAQETIPYHNPPME